LYNKANELQEDISMKRFDLRVAQIHLAAVRAQVSTHVNTYDARRLIGRRLDRWEDAEIYCGAENQ
jgi:hypothetical protein